MADWKDFVLISREESAVITLFLTLSIQTIASIAANRMCLFGLGAENKSLILRVLHLF